MSKFKLFGIIMMFTMSIFFTSCLDDGNDSPNTDSINELLEGEWFLVKEYNSFEENTTMWDYENQTDYGEDSDGTSQNPVKIRIEKIKENEYWFYSYTYSGSWKRTSIQEAILNGNILSEEIYEEEDLSGTSKIYISTLTESTLVIEADVVASYRGISYSWKITQTYRRNN